MPAKWIRIWGERFPHLPLDAEPIAVGAGEAAVREGAVDIGLLRQPVERDGLAVVPLYEETTVVVVPKDHAVSAVDAVTVADLEDEVVLTPADDTLTWPTPPGTPAQHTPSTTSDAIELVAAGVGVVVVPKSLARLHHRRDVVHRPVEDAPTSRVVLVWREDRADDRTEDFVGIVRGRTANSSRGRTQPSNTSGRSASGKASGGNSAAGKSTPGTSTGGTTAKRASGTRRAAGGTRSSAGRGKRGGPRRRR
ncbi:LysR family transcriptional regulator substrate-binding protein [Rhodococcus sp. HNM0569]|nr:LysR family transcriptional regulator substrate-binding protein [Rhodococcus sp. HNM0569]NLU81406.1 LysR family transcriptional regulator substrate-binding protein [Rhodococcus sp. HNM0569]